MLRNLCYTHVLHVVFDVLWREKKRRPTDCGMCISDASGFVGGKNEEPSLILPPSVEGGRPAELRIESVCLCLYMWPIVVCSDELRFEALCSINLLIPRPQCATKLISVHESSYFGALELQQPLELLTTIKGSLYTADCITKGFDENCSHQVVH